MRDIGRANAKSKLDLFREVSYEIGEHQNSQTKNFMSDRCVTQKKSNNFSIKVKKEYLILSEAAEIYFLEFT